MKAGKTLWFTGWALALVAQYMANGLMPTIGLAAGVLIVSGACIVIFDYGSLVNEVGWYRHTYNREYDR